MARSGRTHDPQQGNYDRRTVGAPTIVCTGQTVMYNNFTRSDGLEKMYTGPYSVVDVKYPNVKIKKGNNRFSWIHLNDCKVVPMSATGESLELEHEHEALEAGQDSSGEVGFDTDEQSQDRDTVVVENLPGEQVGMECSEQQMLWCSSRIRKEPDRFGNPIH